MNIRSLVIASVLSLLAASSWATEPLEGVGSDGVFRINPQRPVAELRAEALAAKPPSESGRFRKVDLAEVLGFDTVPDGTGVALRTSGLMVDGRGFFSDDVLMLDSNQGPARTGPNRTSSGRIPSGGF